jgi:hypothetical protein
MANHDPQEQRADEELTDEQQEAASGGNELFFPDL